MVNITPEIKLLVNEWQNKNMSKTWAAKQLNIAYDTFKKLFPEYICISKVSSIYILEKEIYEKSPRLCKQCQAPLEFKHKNRFFCSSSCSGTFNSTNRICSESTKQKISNALSYYYKGNTHHTHICQQQLLLNLKYKHIRNKNLNEKLQLCTVCNIEFTSFKNKRNGFTTICSDKCYIRRKQLNARGNKNLFYKNERYDSSWEIRLAEFLDKNNFEWIRPNSIKWIDKNNKQRRYFADFYLPKYNLYLDPKNPICVNQQQEKLSVVKQQINLIYGDINYIIQYLQNMVGETGIKPA